MTHIISVIGGVTVYWIPDQTINEISGTKSNQKCARKLNLKNQSSSTSDLATDSRHINRCTMYIVCILLRHYRNY